MYFLLLRLFLSLCGDERGYCYEKYNDGGFNGRDSFNWFSPHGGICLGLCYCWSFCFLQFGNWFPLEVCFEGRSFGKEVKKMQVRDILFDSNSFGVTQRSLKILRDTIAERFHHRIAVVEVPVGNCCGFLIFDKDTGEAIWTGDGFRDDECGEGGAGYTSANALFRIFGIRQLFWEPVNPDEIIGVEEGKAALALLVIACAIGETLEPGDFLVPAEKDPYYVRHLNLVFNSSRKRENFNRKGEYQEEIIDRISPKS